MQIWETDKCHIVPGQANKAKALTLGYCCWLDNPEEEAMNFSTILVGFFSDFFFRELRNNLKKVLLINNLIFRNPFKVHNLMDIEKRYHHWFGFTISRFFSFLCTWALPMHWWMLSFCTIREKPRFITCSNSVQEVWVFFNGSQSVSTNIFASFFLFDCENFWHHFGTNLLHVKILMLNLPYTFFVNSYSFGNRTHSKPIIRLYQITLNQSKTLIIRAMPCTFFKKKDVSIAVFQSFIEIKKRLI